MATSSRPVGQLRFEILGPTVAWRGATEISLGPPQQRATLALFLTRVGQSVSLDDVIHFLWGRDRPASAASVVHKYLSALRHSFEPGLPARRSGRWLVRQGNGYRLDVDDDCLDLLRFRGLTEQGRQLARCGRHNDAVTLFVAALELWKGQCAAGTECTPGSQFAFTAVDQEGARVAQEAADSALHGGCAQQVLAVVRRSAARDRLDEALQARLMLVLAAAGRQAEALETYHHVRGMLSEDLGIDPGPELSSAYQQVLRQRTVSPPTNRGLSVGGSEEPDPGTDSTEASGSAVPVVPVVRPAQLPAGLSTFVGRQDELIHLDSLLSAPGRVGHAVGVVGVGGMAGVGKTCLAIHWAQSLTDHFPDGQLYVNLRGFDPGGSAVPAGDALRGFLEACGVPAERIPSSPNSRASLYRSLLAGRRMLVLLDNARDAEQVRDLLPGSPGCLVIVTSRTQLTALAATHDACVLDLDPFSSAEVREALARKVGADRVANEPAAVEEITTYCAGLPAAVAVVAARAATAKRRTLGDISGELWDAETRLDALTLGDPTTDLRSMFSWSYHLLSPQAARLFRLICLHAGPEISQPATASLAGLAAARVRLLLGELCRAQVLNEHRSGRYTTHGLLRLYGSELANGEECEPDRRSALGRLLDHYLRTAHQAQSRFHLLRGQVPLSGVTPGTTPEQVSDHDQAMAWFTMEHQVLVAMIEKAAHHGFNGHAWQLALSMREYCQWSGNWSDWITTAQAALGAAQRADDRVGQAHAHGNLGTAHRHLGDIDEAVSHLKRSLALCTENSRATGDPDAHTALAAALAEAGRRKETSGLHREAAELHGAALGHSRQALALSRVGGNQRAAALALVEEGRLGRRAAGIDLIEQAMGTYRELNGEDHHGQAHCWVGLGDLHHRDTEYQRAVECYERAIMLYRRLGIRTGEAAVFHVLGDALLALGNRTAADTAWRRAFASYDGLHLPQAEVLHAKLHREEARWTLTAIP